METYLTELLKTLSGLGPEAFTIVACIAFGYVIRLIPFIPNTWIPAICILSAPAIYPFLTGPGRVSPDSEQPIVRIVMTGLILGVAAWILHDKAISRIESKLMGWFAAKAGSKRYRKTADGNFEEVKDKQEK